MSGGAYLKRSGQKFGRDAHFRAGSLFLWAAVFCGLCGGTLSFLWQSHGLSLSPSGRAALLLYHLVGIVFLGFVPALFQGMGTIFVPVLTGGHDMALPRLSRWSFFAQIGSCTSYFAGLLKDADIVFLQICLLLWSISLLLYMANVAVSILNNRSADVGLLQIPSFVLAQLLSAVVGMFTLPVFIAHLIKIYMQTGLSLGALPVLQNFLHMYDFALIVLLLLPVMGVAAHSVQTFSGQLRFKAAFDSALLLMACAGGAGWAHWVFGLSASLTASFISQGKICIGVVLAAEMVALAILGRNLLQVHCFRRALPLYWVVALLLVNSLGCMGWLFGRMNVAQYHSFMAFDCLLACFCGFYLWAEKITGWRLSPLLGKIHFSLLFSGILCTLLSGGYEAGVTKTTIFLALGLTGLSLLAFVALIGVMVCKREPIKKRACWGNQATTREWHATTPLFS